MLNGIKRLFIYFAFLLLADFSTWVINGSDENNQSSVFKKTFGPGRVQVKLDYPRIFEVGVHLHF